MELYIEAGFRIRILIRIHPLKTNRIRIQPLKGKPDPDPCFYRPVPGEKLGHSIMKSFHLFYDDFQ